MPDENPKEPMHVSLTIERKEPDGSWTEVAWFTDAEAFPGVTVEYRVVTAHV